MPEGGNAVNPLAGAIVCPVDLTDLSISALRLAVAIGERCAMPVTALHAYGFEVPAYLTAGRASQIEQERKRSRLEAWLALRRFISRALEESAATARVEEGDAGQAILEASKALDAGLIVMGTHGLGGIRRLALGSVAEQVVHESETPVLTIRENLEPAEISRIVCAVNDSAASRLALSHAVKLAVCLGAHLIAVHVVESGAPGSIPDLCAWTAAEGRPNCEIQEVTRHGHAVAQIMELVTQEGADLLVIGAEHRMLQDKTVLGATAAQLVRHAPCAVLTGPAL
jgi:nucleotide-binding universal stress UspA family protein